MVGTYKRISLSQYIELKHQSSQGFDHSIYTWQIRFLRWSYYNKRVLLICWYSCIILAQKHNLGRRNYNIMITFSIHIAWDNKEFHSFSKNTIIISISSINKDASLCEFKHWSSWISPWDNRRWFSNKTWSKIRVACEVGKFHLENKILRRLVIGVIYWY